MDSERHPSSSTVIINSDHGCPVSPIGTPLASKRKGHMPYPLAVRALTRGMRAIQTRFAHPPQSPLFRNISQHP